MMPVGVCCHGDNYTLSPLGNYQLIKQSTNEHLNNKTLFFRNEFFFYLHFLYLFNTQWHHDEAKQLFNTCQPGDVIPAPLVGCPQLNIDIKDCSWSLPGVLECRVIMFTLWSCYWSKN